jgi:hypothetical protein
MEFIGFRNGKLVGEVGFIVDSGGNLSTTNFVGWNGVVNYSDWAWVEYGGKLYKSLQINNLNNIPDASPTWWLSFVEEVGGVFNLQNTLFLVNDASITDVKVAPNANIDVSKLGTGIISNAEFNELSGLTENIQSGLNSKLPLAGGTLVGPVLIGAGGTIKDKNSNNLLDENGVIWVTGEIVDSTGTKQIVSSIGVITIAAGASLKDKNSNSVITEDGAVIRKIKTLTVADTPYQVLPSDSVLLVDTTLGNVDVNLESAATAGVGRELAIKKIDSSSNLTSIFPTNTGNTIDGVTQVDIINQNDTFSIVSNGSNWFII